MYCTIPHKNTIRFVLLNCRTLTFSYWQYVADIKDQQEIKCYFCQVHLTITMKSLVVYLLGIILQIPKSKLRRSRFASYLP